MRRLLDRAPRLTGRGKWVLGGAILLLVVGLVFEDAAMIRISLCWILLLLTALPFSYLNMSGLKYTHTFPDAVCKGETFYVELALENQRRHMEAFDIEVRDALVRRSLGGQTGFQTVHPGQTATLLEPTRMSRRGIFENHSYELISQFPLGLACYEQQATIRDRLVVYPVPKLPPDVRNLLESECGSGRSRQTASSDVTGEFRSIREYQPGDHAKLISWPLSTRFQELIVREMENPGPQQVTVIFHSYRPGNTLLTQRSFERSLQLLSGLFVYLYNHYIPFDFVSAFNRWERMSIPPDPRRLKESLESLAGARLTISKNLGQLAKTIEREAKSSVSLIVVSNTPTHHWQDAIPTLSVPVVYMDNSDSGVLTPQLLHESRMIS